MADYTVRILKTKKHRFRTRPNIQQVEKDDTVRWENTLNEPITFTFAGAAEVFDIAEGAVLVPGQTYVVKKDNDGPNAIAYDYKVYCVNSKKHADADHSDPQIEVL